MLQHIQQLHRIANAQQRLIIGLMSGTSLDGLDIALCLISGHGKNTKVTCEKFTTVAYSESTKQAIKHVFAKAHGSIDALCLLNAQIGTLHSTFIKQTLSKWDVALTSIDLIASHGQTIYHRPSSLRHPEMLLPEPDKVQQNSTLQIGDGDHIAANTGIITVSDFRQKHIAHGGEGAPLAMYGDYIMLSDHVENRVLLNIGGIANITYIPANAAFCDVICSDVGPGNTVMDALMFEQKQMSFDKNAIVAKQGQVNAILLAALTQHPFINLPMPKTTGPETFNVEWFKSLLINVKLSDLSLADQMATLNYYSAYCIAQSLKHLPAKLSLYVSGGGSHNPLLLENISTISGLSVNKSDKIGINADAKEAILFAVLANECVAGNKNTFISERKNQPNISMGKVSFP